MKFEAELKEILTKTYRPLAKDFYQAPHYSVALIINSQQEILLIERAERQGDHWSGQMAFPGGKAEKEDKDFMATAIRESHEEVRLNLSPINCLSPLLEIPLRKRGLPVPGVLHSYVFYINETGKRLNFGPAEVQNVFWIPFDYFADSKKMGHYRLVRDAISIDLPCIDFGEKKIWGLTYQLLAHFFLSIQSLDRRDYSHMLKVL